MDVFLVLYLLTVWLALIVDEIENQVDRRL